MTTPTAIATVDGGYLCNVIQSAKKRLVFITPGTSDPVAGAVCHKCSQFSIDIPALLYTMPLIKCG
jgi:hypothetical protein